MLKALLVLALLLAGCATAPKSPIKSAWVPDAAWWSSASANGGILRTKENAIRHVNPAHAKNLHEVHAALARQSRMTATLALVEADAPNAFATSNQGTPVIAVSLDFLEALGNDRDALAATLGHELAHLYYSHGTARQERASAAQGASHVIGAILGLAGVPLGGTIASVGVSAVTTSFSRDEEREADAKGLEWATAAGFNACGSARTIRLFQSRGGGASIPFLSTHPGYEERIERANATSTRLTGRGC